MKSDFDFDFDLKKEVESDLAEKGLLSRWFPYSSLGIDCLLFFRKFYKDGMNDYYVRASEVGDFCGRRPSFAELYNCLCSTVFEQFTFYWSNSRYYNISLFQRISLEGEDTYMQFSDFAPLAFGDLSRRISDADAECCVSMDGEDAVAKRLYLYFCQFAGQGEQELKLLDAKGMLVPLTAYKVMKKIHERVPEADIISEIDRSVAVINGVGGIKVDFRHLYDDGKYRGISFTVSRAGS